MKKPPTLQTIFNRVARHLLKQRKRSTLAKYPDTCAYRGANGTRCAVGCLIRNKYYSPTFEGLGSINPSVREALRKSFGFTNQPKETLPSDVAVLLCALQGLHDVDHPRNWRKGLTRIAHNFALLMPEAQR